MTAVRPPGSRASPPARSGPDAAAGTAAAQGLDDGADEDAGAEGPLDPVLAERPRDGGVEGAGDRDDGGGPRGVRDAPVQVGGQRRDRQVEDDRVGAGDAGRGGGAGGVGHDLDVVALPGEVAALQLGDRRVVLGHEDEPAAVAVHGRPFDRAVGSSPRSRDFHMADASCSAGSSPVPGAASRPDRPAAAPRGAARS